MTGERGTHRMMARKALSMLAHGLLATALLISVPDATRAEPGTTAPAPNAPDDIAPKDTTADRHLHIGLGAAITSLDPHFHRYIPNQTVAQHIFEPLIRLTDQLDLEPGLALAWERQTPTVWRITLRPGVRFHDGQPLTSQDVLASLRRPGRATDSPFSRHGALSVIERVEVIDPLTLDLHTDHPAPTLPRILSQLAILPARLEGVPSEAFSDPGTTIGTGPFRFTGGSLEDRLDLAVNPDYWGETPAWNRVTLHILTDDARRVTALIDGSVDMIEHVPPPDAARLMINGAFRVLGHTSTRVMYLGLDVARPASPFVTATDGQAIPNPLQHLAVRQAISLAIDRPGLLRNVLQGHGEAANQVLAPTVLGHVPDLPPLPYDLPRARALMAQAGLAEGVRLTLHCPRDRYVTDNQIAAALARMLSRAGLQTTADCMEAKTFFRRAAQGAFSVYLAGLAVGIGEGGESLTALIGRPTVHTTWGALNRGGWGSPDIDALLRSALDATTPSRRTAALQDAVRLATHDLSVIPLYIQQSTWAMRADLDYTARTDELTLAQQVRPAAP